MCRTDTMAQLRELQPQLLPEGFAELQAFAAHLMAAREAGEPHLEPAEFSRRYWEGRAAA